MALPFGVVIKTSKLKTPDANLDLGLYHTCDSGMIFPYVHFTEFAWLHGLGWVHVLSAQFLNLKYISQRLGHPL